MNEIKPHDINEAIESSESELSEKDVQGALLYIPDISGFTKFITGTEISHSRHIIAELLEIIIDSDELNLNISEVEGDSVLFYKFGKPSGLKAIVSQSEKIFLNFHTHLKLYERDRICSCSACSNAKNLSLKFLVHYGKISKIQVRNHESLIGEDVILAHKLLKNNIPEDEYILISEKYSSAIGKHSERIENTALKEGSMNVEEFGKVNFTYQLLSELHEKIKTPPLPEDFERTENPVMYNILIHASLKKVHRVITDFDLLPVWSSRLKNPFNIAFRLKRTNLAYEKILSNRMLNIELTKDMISKGHVEYIEKFGHLPLFGNMNLYRLIKLHRFGSITKLSFEIHYKPRPGSIFNLIREVLIRSILKRRIMNSARRLKELCEQE